MKPYQTQNGEKQSENIREQLLLHPRLFKVYDKHTEEIFNNPKVCQANKEHIRKFLLSREAGGGTIARLANYAQRLKQISFFYGERDFLSLQRSDIDEFMATIQCRCKQATVNGMIAILKCFFRHIYGLTKKDNAPEPVKHLEKKDTMKQNFNPEMLMTEQEMDKIFETAPDIRTKAILAVLFCGVRNAELRSIKMNDVRYPSMEITVRGGKMREKNVPKDLFPITGLMELRSWYSSHTGKDEPNCYLFGTYNHQTKESIPLGDSYLKFLVKDLAKKAGVKGKIVGVYGYRRKILTEVYSNPKYSTEEARRVARHSDGRMATIYCGLGRERIKDAVVRANDCTKCQNCGTINKKGLEYCSYCKSPLSQLGAVRLSADRVNDYDEFAKFIMNIVQRGNIGAEEAKLKAALDRAKEKFEKGKSSKN